MRTALLLLMIGISACKSEPLSRDNPRDAFGRLAPCVDRASTGCLLKELDRDSRWSVHSVHRTLAETRALVEASYPTDPAVRGSAFGSWAREAAAGDVDGMFMAFCEKRDCLRTLASGFGAVVSDRAGEKGTRVVETTRGAGFVMAAVEGEWGLATFREELLDAKTRLADNLEQVRRNVADYDEQRLATGDPKETK